MPNLQYTLIEHPDEKSVEIIRTGDFIDRNGQEVEITAADLDALVANFQAGEAGQDVPIDIDHERASAAGWLKTLFREGDRLLGTIEWNDLGKQLVGDKIYKYLSALISLPDNIIKAVSLVNFPAVKGLKPIELSEGVFVHQIETSFFQSIATKLDRLIELAQKPKTEPKKTEPKKVELAKEKKTMNEQELAELREQIRSRSSKRSGPRSRPN